MEEKENNPRRKATQEELAEAIKALRGKWSTLPTPMFRDIKPAPPDRFGTEDGEEE